MPSYDTPRFSRNIQRSFAIYSLCFQRMVENAFAVLSDKYDLKEPLCYSHNAILQCLYYQEKPLTLAEISKRSGQALPNVSVAASALRANEMILCEKTHKDKRKYSVTLSDKGRRVCDDYVANMLPMICDQLFEGISDEHLDVLHDVLEQMEINAQKCLYDLDR